MRAFLAFLLVGLMALLVGCAPAADSAAHALNARTGDQLELLLVPGVGIVVDPHGVAERVVVSAFADAFTSIPSECMEVETLVIECRLGMVSERTVLAVRGSSVSADIVYWRAGVERPFREQAIVGP